jgi:hypothetical protein
MPLAVVVVLILVRLERKVEVLVVVELVVTAQMQPLLQVMVL